MTTKKTEKTSPTKKTEKTSPTKKTKKAPSIQKRVVKTSVEKRLKKVAPVDKFLSVANSEVVGFSVPKDWIQHINKAARNHKNRSEFFRELLLKHFTDDVCKNLSSPSPPGPKVESQIPRKRGTGLKHKK